MSKVLNIPNGDYLLKVQTGGTITLDTGGTVGDVIINSNLVVNGTSAIINAEELSIADNVITVNFGETGAGISAGIAGIMVDRGTSTDVQFVWTEAYNSWHAVDTLGNTVGLRANSVSTNGENLSLIGTGTGVITVSGTTDYEDQITDDDHIPNKKYVDNAIETSYELFASDRIQEGNTKVEIFDTGVGSVNMEIDSSSIFNLTASSATLYDMTIGSTSISTTNINDDLELSTTGTGTVKLNSILEVVKKSVPSSPSDGVRIYSQSEGEGGTGTYFINEDGTNDELISKNRALLFSMIF